MSLDDKDLQNGDLPEKDQETTAEIIGLDEDELFKNSTVFSQSKVVDKKKKGKGKRVRNIIAAVLMLAILAGSVFAIIKFIPTTEEVEAQNSSSTAASLDIEVISVKENDLTGISITNSNGTFKIVPGDTTVDESTGEQTLNWYLDGVDKAYSDTTTIGSIVKTVTTLKAVRVMEADADDLAKYGLDAPAISVDVESDIGEASYVMLIGSDSPTADGRYGMIEGENTVYLFDNVIVSEFTGKLTDYIVAQMLNSISKTDSNADYFGDDGTLSTFDYICIGGRAHTTPIRIEINPYNTTSYIPYIMTSPVKQNVLGDTGDLTLSPIKSGLLADNIYEIEPDAATIAKYGLDDPLVTIEYKVGDYTANLRVANAPDDSSYYAVMVNDTPMIYKLVKTELSFAEYTPEKFFNNYILLDDITTVKTITVTTATGTRVYNLTHGVDENEEATLEVKEDGKVLNTEYFRYLYRYMLTCHASEFTMDSAPEGAAELTMVFDYIDDARPDLSVSYKKATDRRYHVSVDGVPLGYAYLNTVDNLIKYETDYYNGESIPKP